ncbi:hypothetical protein [Providencia manganoxydans]|uniref:hypothetical protein n=1 Tax=Providencia manganoxydans TaxID=2923283 RepID=UPI003F70A3E4
MSSTSKTSVLNWIASVDIDAKASLWPPKANAMDSDSSARRKGVAFGKDIKNIPREQSQ